MLYYKNILVGDCYHIIDRNKDILSKSRNSDIFILTSLDYLLDLKYYYYLQKNKLEI